MKTDFNELAEKWGGAYRADYNGREVSVAVIKAMFDEGLTEPEAKWVYFSKHLRWFFDSHNDNVSKTRVRMLFRAYINGRNQLRRDLQDYKDEIETDA